jgi:hypothetical protein
MGKILYANDTLPCQQLNVIYIKEPGEKKKKNEIKWQNRDALPDWLELTIAMLKNKSKSPE